jgi:hypothetical protein
MRTLDLYGFVNIQLKNYSQKIKSAQTPKFIVQTRRLLHGRKWSKNKKLPSAM